MERSAWPKSLSSSRKREIQELCGQNPKKLIGANDAHSQTGDDPRQPLFAGDLIFSVRRSFSSNTQSLSSGTKSSEGFPVPSNAFVSSEISEGSESIRSPVQRSTVQRSTVQNVKPPVQRSSVSIFGEVPPMLDELSQEDTHYSQTVSTILQKQPRWADSASYVSNSTQSAFCKWTSRSDQLFPPPAVDISQWVLKYILFSIPFLHAKYRDGNSPKSRDI